MLLITYIDYFWLLLILLFDYLILLFDYWLLIINIDYLKNEGENLVSKHPTHQRITHLVLFNAKRERYKLLFKTQMFFTTSSKYKAIYPSGWKGKVDFKKQSPWVR